MKCHFRLPLPLLCAAVFACSLPTAFSGGAITKEPAGGKLTEDEGYHGIWYFNQATKDEYKFKYSGGFATYPYQHNPIAIYRKEVDKTFFVYGGTTARKPGDKQVLLHMVSYYDHKTGEVPRPRILQQKHLRRT